MRALCSANAWCIACIAVAAILAWAGKDVLNPDGLSYLDLASEAVRGGPARLISGYWSPGYPAAIAAVLAILRPSAAGEVPAIHLLNFLIFLLALATFRGFVQVLARRRDSLLIPLAFATFLCLVTLFLNPAVVTPDLLLAAVLFAVFDVVWRLSRTSSLSGYVQLGLLLGCAYYIKAAAFVLALMLLGVLAASLKWRRIRGTGLLASFAAFCCVSAPLVALVTKHAGHLTIGEAGSLNYLWYVDHRELTENRGWNGSFGSEPLTHAPRVLLDRPLTVEFADPVPGTYPLWYAPDYWWAGAGPHLMLPGQLQAILESLANYSRMLLPLAPWIVALAALCAIARRKPRRSSSGARLWVWLWPVLAFVMFGLVHVEGRFVAPFFILLIVATYRAIAIRVPPRALSVTTLAIVAAAMLIAGVEIAHATRRALRAAAPDAEILARELESLGVRPGDRLAVVGNAFDAFYARYGRTRITAQVQDAGSFWHASAAGRDAVFGRLRAHGVTAVTAGAAPRDADLTGWRIVRTPDNRYFVRLLAPAKDAH